MNNLNQLSDAELSAVFAGEVAKRHLVPFGAWQIPNYADSMDAVLPYFAARDEYCEIRYGHGIWVCFIGPNEIGISSYDHSPKALKTTMPRAACIALILAARAEKEAAK